LETEGLDAIVVAAAGVKRLGLADRVSEFLPPEVCLPAIGQGALGIEIREPTLPAGRQGAERREPSLLRIVSVLDHAETHVAVRAERAMLRRLQGGCQVPIAAYAEVVGDTVVLQGLVASLDGKTLARGEMRGKREDPQGIGTALAEDLLSRGAGEILQALLPASYRKGP
jgi:hydroxymethylbilane synthase